MVNYLDRNRKMWDDWAVRHRGSAFYDVAAFLAGKTSLKALELEELGDVRGKRLLHLQCHFGQDTLSWAREGAVVTGVDFSGEGIRLARELSAESGLPGTFIQADVLDLPRELDAQFDVVFTSYGVLIWLPDLRPWAAGIARCLKPGGTFYIVEFHPLLWMLDESGDGFQYSYFGGTEPEAFAGTGSYADRSAEVPHTSFEWAHPLSEIVTALVEQGLRLEFIHEFPYVVHPCWDFLVEAEPGRYVLKSHPGKFPLLFSLKATRPA